MADSPALTSPPAVTQRLSVAGQVFLVAGLVLLFWFVLLGVIELGAVIALVVGAIAESPLLAAASALDEDLGPALAIGLLLPVLTIAVALATRGARWAYAKANGKGPLELPWYGSRIYLMFGTWLVYELLLRLPLDLARLWDASDVRMGGALIAALVFVVLLLALKGLQLTWVASRGIWNACQTRPVLSGMVTATALIASGGGWLVGEVAEETLSLPEASSSGPCARDPVECTREVLVAAALPPGGQGSSGGSGAGLASFFGGIGTGGGDGFSSCIERLHAPPEPSAVTEARRIIRDEDVVHDTVLAVCLVHQQKPRRDLRTYFFRSLRNNNREPSDWIRCTSEVPSCQVGRDDEASFAAQHRAVERILCTLPEGEADALRLLVLEDLDGPEIADRLGITPAAARQRLASARRKLREQFSQYCR